MKKHELPQLYCSREIPSSVISDILQEYDITLTVTLSMISTYTKKKYDNSEVNFF